MKKQTDRQTNMTNYPIVAEGAYKKQTDKVNSTVMCKTSLNFKENEGFTEVT